jgi:hypothetical protein|tara:strand:- start:2017 stop:2208 length:192 start_codon:yes stop_codon:yes gene_type:complete
MWYVVMGNNILGIFPREKDAVEYRDVVAKKHNSYGGLYVIHLNTPHVNHVFDVYDVIEQRGAK